MNRPSSPAQSPARAVRILVATALLLPFGSLAARAHQVDATAPHAPGYNRNPIPGADEPSPFAGSAALKLEHMREDERRKRLRSDTEKLLQLSTELKEQVAKASKDELSLDVVRKAAEIEKLAHDVKEHMKS